MKQKKGISLIVLVITIVVMIVLASAIILSLQSSGIIGRANKASRKSDDSNMLQAANVVYGEYLLEKNLGGIGANDITPQEYIKEKLEKQGFNENELERLNISSDGTLEILPVIPEGFTVSRYEGEQKVSDGLVIYKTDKETLAAKNQLEAQRTYDQFVWVPVPDISDFVRTEWLDNKPTNTISENYKEPLKSGYNMEVSDYNKMKASVEKYGGFYIGRYEAGTTEERTGTTIGTAEVVVRKDKPVYNYVAWGNNVTDISSDIIDSNKYNRGKGAVYLSQNLYEKNDNYITNLIYGVQWDATLRWLSDEYNVTDSRSWGNYNNSTEPANVDSGSRKSCGYSEAWKAKNIYDFAGNVWEWTIETGPDQGKIYRGGHAGISGYNYSASHRYNDVTTFNFNRNGFRPVLYMK